MDTGLNKPFNRSSVITEQLWNNQKLAKNDNDSHFLLLIKKYHLSVLETIFVETFRLKLYMQ